MIRTKEQYIASLMEIVPSDDQPPWHNYSNFLREAEEMYKEGWTLSDAHKLFRCSEEVSPDLDEDVALKRMDDLRKKYEPAPKA